MRKPWDSLIAAFLGRPVACCAPSPAKRARELLPGVPGLVAWQTAAALRVLEEASPAVEAVREVYP